MQSKKPVRRKLLMSIAVGGGFVTASESLPRTWTKPLIEAVLLPAHAQTSPTTFSDTQSSGPLCTVFNNLPAPSPAPFVFSWPGLTPTDRGTLRVTATGDINGNEPAPPAVPLEAWNIEINGNPLGSVGNTGGLVPASDTQTFTVPLADLSGGSATITAINQGAVDCDNAGPAAFVQNDVTVTLTFPANIN